MGKIFELSGMVPERELSDEIAKMKPVQRQEEIEKIHNGDKLVGIYSPETFTVSFHGEVVTINQGWNQYAPTFGVWALQKYGKGSKYGQTYRTTAEGKTVPNPALLDENPDGEAPKAERRTRVKAEAE